MMSIAASCLAAKYIAGLPDTRRWRSMATNEAGTLALYYIAVLAWPDRGVLMCLLLLEVNVV